MLFTNVAIVVVSFATSATAFFPFIPGYRCELDESPCKDGKRAVDTDAESLSLKIVQRLPENDSPQNVQRLAEGLRRKYQRRPASQVEPQLEDANMVKRANTHSIVTASPPTQTNSAGIDQDGTDFSYFAEVQLGSSNTPMYLLLDTGAGTTWVMGSDCTSDPCKTHDNFGSSDSKTFKDLSSPFNISYGSGSVAGSMAQDSLSIAGMTFTATFGIASTTSNQFNSFPIDGILGLSLSKSNGQTFWETLVASKVLKSNLVGISLNRNSDGPNTGEINFGSPDTSRFTGTLNYFTSVTNPSDDWAVQINDIGVGSSQTGISSIAYVDTGTSFIFAPPADAQKLHASIPGAKSSDGSTYTVPCTTTTPLVFSFGDSTYSVSSKDWVSPMVNGACTSNVYGMSVVDDSSWLIGDTFLKNVYAVFDYDQSRIGFAQNKAVTSSSSSAAASSTTGWSSSTTTQTSSMASTTASSFEPPTTSTESKSNSESTGTSSVSTTLSSVTGSSSSGASSTGSPGLNGHQTLSSTTGAASAGESTTSPSPAASATQKSSAIFLNPSLYSAIFAAGSLIALLL
ncbi:Aspartic-type endopeptidase ctsD [Lachnellula suecica]|uniref:Aspartic-type endopeptidase ctsD n=1 Tax=Lachnellula suecica TaxID=602035 RepID=A0A8T9C9A7_9HELO|nr:Aspartic-type endopeptidase ctsD [Lachnellula suecica]